MEPALPHRRHDTRPWGHFEQFTQGEQSTVKLLYIDPSQLFSLQKHVGRDEFWHVISGSGTLTIGDVQVHAEPSQECYIPRGTPHRAEAGTNTPLIILEISFGSFDEGDIVRIEDKYGRV